MSLAPYGYLQDAVKNVFGSAALGEIGAFALKIAVPEGADIEPYISVVDNKTGDNLLIPGTAAGEGVLVLPRRGPQPRRGGDGVADLGRSSPTPTMWPTPGK